MSKVCCGITYSDKDRFCRVCGKRLEDNEEKTVLINEQQIRNANEDDEPGTSVLTADMRGPIKHPENAAQAGNKKEDAETNVTENETKDDKQEDNLIDSKSKDISADDDKEDNKNKDNTVDNKDSSVDSDKEDNKNKDNAVGDKDSKDGDSSADDKNDNDEDDEDSTTSILTADMKKQAPQTQPNGVPRQPMASQMPSMQPNGRPMQQMPGQMPPMQPNGRPMQQMLGQMQPMQQPAKPKKSEEQKEKSAKTCGLISLIISGIGLVAVAVMLFFFVLNADYKKYDKEAEKGLYSSTPTTETASFGDTLNSEGE